jgi:serine/threonine protein kinase
LSALESNRANQRSFNFFSQLRILRGVLRGMSIISKSSIVHRDLAARNILLGPSMEPKIADFGFSRNIGTQKEGQTDTDLGPIRWMVRSFSRVSTAFHL